MSKRILLINHYAGGLIHGMEYRPFYFAREWVRNGHKVLIIAASFSHIRQKNPTVKKLIERETIDGIDYLWVKTPLYTGNGIRRAINMAVFIMALYTLCRKTINSFKPNVVIASSTYTWDNWPAYHYAKKYKACYVYEVHDLWPLSPMLLGKMSARNPFIWSLQCAENFACRHADKIISLLPAAEQHLMEHGMAKGRFTHIPNGINENEWSSPTDIPIEHNSLIDKFREYSKFIVGYVGGHGVSNALDQLIEAAADKRLNKIGVICVGNGIEKERLKIKAEQLGANVLFLDPVAKQSVPALMRKVDLLYIGWARSPLYQYGISPNKLFEYMMAGVPVLHAVEAANDPVKEAECGLSIAPEDPEALCNAILKLASLPETERQAMGERASKYVKEHHTIEMLADKFLKIVDD